MIAKTSRSTFLCLCAFVLAACGGGGGGGGSGNPPPPSSFTIGGTITGLAGTGLVLQNSGGNNLSPAASGNFTFSSAVNTGATYNVTVITQPNNPSQTCSVTNGSGTVASSHVTSVAITCTTNTYTVGGTVTGLNAPGLVLQNNSGNDLPIHATGAFTFPSPVASGSAYAVTVSTQPASATSSQTCTVTNGGGTVSNAGITNVNVTCTAQVARFLYSANTGSNSVSAFSINANTGALTAVPGSPFASNVAPLFMTANRAKTALYVATNGDVSTPPRISAYSINGTTGALTAVPGSPFDLSATPSPGPAEAGKPIVPPSGATVYLGLRNTPNLFGFSVDSNTGSLTLLSGIPGTGAGQQFGSLNRAGNALYVPHDNLNGGQAGAVDAYTVATPSGALTPLGSAGTGGRGPGGINFNLAGNRLFTGNFGTGSVAVFLVDATNGTLTAAPGSPFSTGAGTTPTSVSVHPNGSFVYTTSTNANPALSSIAGFQMNTSTGVLTPIAGTPILTGGGMAAVGTVDPSGKFFYVTNTIGDNIQGFAIDATTGALTAVPGSPFVTEDAPAPLVIDPSGKYLYSVNTDAGTISSYAINATTGALTLVNTVTAGTKPRFPELVQ